MLQVVHEEIFFVPVPVHNTIEVIENLYVQNPGSTTQNVTIGLPRGYQGLTVNAIAQKDIHARPDEVLFTSVAKAKSATTVTLTYALPLPKNQQGITFQLHSNYPVYTAKLYLPEGSGALSAQGLLLQTQAVKVSGTNFRVYTRPGIDAGDNWSINISKLPIVTSSSTATPSGTSVSTPSSLPILGQTGGGNTVGAVLNLCLAAFVLIIGLLSVRATSFGRRRAPMSKRDALYEAWVNIEEAHHNGALADDVYETRRSQVREKIISEIRSDRGE